MRVNLMKRLNETNIVNDTSKFHDNHTGSMTNPTMFPTAGNYYDLYRLGVHFATHPDHAKIHGSSPSASGPVGEHPLTNAYTDEDQEIVNRAAKLCGFTPRKLGGKYSKESDDIHRHSPVKHNSVVHIRKRHWRKDLHR